MPIEFPCRCLPCLVPVSRDTSGGECAVCRADRAGTVRYREGMRFYVTAARVADLGRWQRGEWIPSRIVEQGITFPQARRLVAQLNENSGGADAEQFYFLTSDRPLHL